MVDQRGWLRLELRKLDQVLVSKTVSENRSQETMGEGRSTSDGSVEVQPVQKAALR